MLYFIICTCRVIICTCACMFCNFYLSVLWSLLVNAAGNTFPNSTMKYLEKVWNLFKVNSEDTRGTSMFLNVSMSMRSFWWNSCIWICFSIYTSIIYFIWYTARYMMRWTRAPRNVTGSTKLWRAQCSPELAFRSTDFRVPENLIFPALLTVKLLHDFDLVKTRN